ncbi:MAG: polymer-forming cytoskeletal protein [Leptospiraceae bacterium]|nr:polymer-forming cytoskeletal protein [Leptospiraceae bacterium]
MKEEKNEEFIVNSIIGEGSEFSGEFKVDGLIRIDGKFKGVIETNGKVLIGKTGIVDTDIRARNVVSGGQVNGNVYASEKVILLSTCKVYGDIVTPILVIEEGVHLQGKCTVIPKP